MEYKQPLMYDFCKKIIKGNINDVFSISTMLNYFITSNNFESGAKYIDNLSLSKDDKARMLKAFRSYKNSC